MILGCFRQDLSVRLLLTTTCQARLVDVSRPLLPFLFCHNRPGVPTARWSSLGPDSLRVFRTVLAKRLSRAVLQALLLLLILIPPVVLRNARPPPLNPPNFTVLGTLCALPAPAWEGRRGQKPL